MIAVVGARENEMKQKHLSWYGAKCIFRHHGLRPKAGALVYEERVIILRARDDDHAIALAEKEARQYAKDVDAEYLEFVDVFHTYEAPKDRAEVYSLMRESREKPDAYLDKFFDTGHEHTRISK